MSLLFYALRNGLWGKQPRGARKRKSKRGKQIGAWPKTNTPIPQTLKADPAVEAYARSDCALKTNARSVGKQMPLLAEFPSYSEWGKGAERWAKTLYSRPISSAIDYFVVNLGDSLGRADNESGGRLKYKSKSRIEEIE